MNILKQLQELDDLIVEKTRPPVTIELRNKLSFSIQQAEAHADAVAKQDDTLARQIEAITQNEERHQTEMANLRTVMEKLEAELVNLKRANKKEADARNDMAKRAHKLHHGQDLNYNV